MAGTILPAVLPQLARWLHLDPFASTGPSFGTEENRAFLQDRIALFAGLGSLMVLGTYAALVLAQMLDAGDPRHPWLGVNGALHAGTAAVLAVIWIVCAQGTRTLDVLGALDAAGSVAACTTASLALAFPGASEEHKFRMILGVTNALIARAAIIPSPPRWTLGVSAAAVVPSILLTAFFHSSRYDRPAVTVRETAVTALWCAVAVAIAALVSRVIYGLRRDVAEARRLGQYTLEEKVAEGGMGVVYRARHAMLKRPTAVKLLPPEKAGQHGLERFEREVQLTSILTHPNTIAIYDYGRTPDGIFYYAMEYLEGVDLERLVRRHGRQDPRRVVHVVRQVCGSLAEAHAAGLIHRDIKPANVVLCERGGMRDVAKVLDFGLVRELGAAGDVGLTGAHTMTGTPLYLSPEAIRAPETADARSDLYAVGAVMYFLLTGRPVFEGATVVEVCGQHLHAEPEPPSRRAGVAFDPALEACVMDCLAKDPAARPPSASALDARLAACAVAPWTAEDARAWWERHGAIAPAASAPSPEVLTVDVSGR
jgi:serine/threonine-protein kinase